MDLLLVRVDDRSEQEFVLARAGRIGRERDCAVRFDPKRDRAVSRLHAEVFREGDGWAVRDLDSANGTWLNDRRVEGEQALLPGDVLRIGTDGPELEVREAASEAIEEAIDPTFVLDRSDRSSEPPRDDRTLPLGDRRGPPIEQLRPPRDEPEQESRSTIFRRRLRRAERRTDQARRQTDRIVRLGGIVVGLLLLAVAAIGWVAWQRGAELRELKEQFAAIEQVRDRCADPDAPGCRALVAEVEEQREEERPQVEALERTHTGFRSQLRAALVSFEAEGLQLPYSWKLEIKNQLEALRGVGTATLQQRFCMRQACFDFFEPWFEEHGLPRGFVNVAWVESSFNPCAGSHKYARGMWQFIPATGRQYKLVIRNEGSRDPRWDERLDPALATEAAVKYLARLMHRNRKAGPAAAPLSMADYNWGRGRSAAIGVARSCAFEGGLSEDAFDVLAMRTNRRCFRDADADPTGGLPCETAKYIVAILAREIVGQNPREFGLDPDLCPDPGVCHAGQVSGVARSCVGVKADWDNTPDPWELAGVPRPSFP